VDLSFNRFDDAEPLRTVLPLAMLLAGVGARQAASRTARCAVAGRAHAPRAAFLGTLPGAFNPATARALMAWQDT